MLTDEEQSNGAGACMCADNRTDLREQGYFCALLRQKIHKLLGIRFRIGMRSKNGRVLFFVR